jgi:hypothetical protein
VNEILDSGNVDSLGNYIEDDAVDHQVQALEYPYPALMELKNYSRKYIKYFLI